MWSRECETTGAVTCVLAGLVIGLSCGARRPLLACPVITVFTSTAFTSPGTPMRHENIEVLGPPGVLHEVQSLQAGWVSIKVSGTTNAQGHLTFNFDYLDYSIAGLLLFYRVVVP